MRGFLLDNVNGLITDIQLVKEMYANVQFDVNEVRAALQNSTYRRYRPREIEQIIKETQDLMERFKSEGKLFKMKLHSPREVRSGFSNFLKFANEEERMTYEDLQGVEVLIYDDLYTSGATVREIIRLLRSINENNTLTVFVLIKQ